jgi:Uma2 family endonuclease
MVAPVITSPREKVTAEQFLSGEETSQPRHLLDGEIFEMDSPTPNHQLIAFRIIGVLMPLLKTGDLFFAPLDVQLDDLNVVQPDIFWIAPDSKMAAITAKRVVGAPDLIIEILSPSTASFDRKHKFKLYETHGVRELWLVDPEVGLVEVWHRVDDKFTRLDIYESGETFDSPLAGKVEVAPMFATTPTPPAQG